MAAVRRHQLCIFTKSCIHQQIQFLFQLQHKIEVITHAAVVILHICSHYSTINRHLKYNIQHSWGIFVYLTCKGHFMSFTDHAKKKFPLNMFWLRILGTPLQLVYNSSVIYKTFEKCEIGELLKRRLESIWLETKTAESGAPTKHNFLWHPLFGYLHIYLRQIDKTRKTALEVSKDISLKERSLPSKSLKLNQKHLIHIHLLKTLFNVFKSLKIHLQS